MPTSAFWKKLLVILPVAVLALVYLYDHRALIARHASAPRLLLLAVSLFLVFGCFLADLSKRRFTRLSDIALPAGFYLYLFMVLTLTGYFFLFRELNAGTWEAVQQRVRDREHLNLKPLQIFRVYRWNDTQILGNFIMLFPLGFFLPLLYRNLRKFGPVLLSALLFSLFVESLQLVTRYRSADVDDVLLNTTGAAFGFAVYSLLNRLFRPSRAGSAPARLLA